MQPGQELLQKWDERVARLHPRMEITGEGLMLGAGTMLAKMARDGRGAPTVALAQLHQLRGVGDAKLLKSLECSIKGRHHRG